jgi:hypothetical protein
MKNLILIACTFSCCSLSPAFAQTQPEEVRIIEERADAKDVFTFDYAVPASPALSLLGLDVSKVTQSNSLRPFVLSLPSVFGGEDGQAIALDMSPGAFIPSVDRRYSTYTLASNEWRRRALRTRAGVALYEGVEDTANTAKNIGSRLSLGFSTSWLDDSDPLMARYPGRTGSAWLECLNDAGPAVLAALSAPIVLQGSTTQLSAAQLNALDTENQRLLREIAALNAERQDAEARRDEAEIERVDSEIQSKRERLITVATALNAVTDASQTALQQSYARTEASRRVGACAQRADRAARLSQDLDIGVGAIWRGEPGRVSDFNSAGGALWVSYRRPFGLPDRVDPNNDRDMRRLNTWWMAGGALRAGFDEFVSTGNAATPEIRADTIDAWVGVERNTDSQRLSVQYGYQERDPTENFSTFERSRTRYLVSWAQRLGERENAVWLNVSYGDAQGHGAFEDDDTLLVSILFAPPNARRIFGAP